MTARLFHLDSFEEEDARRRAPAIDPKVALQAVRDEGYARGFADGAARAAEAAANQATSVQNAISEALSDLRLTLESARVGAEADLQDLVEAIASAALTPVVAADFSARVIAVVREELFQDAFACVTLRLSAADFDVVAGHLPEGIGVISDPELTAGIAVIETDSGLTRVDMPLILSRIAQTVSQPRSAFTDTEEVSYERHF